MNRDRFIRLATLVLGTAGLSFMTRPLFAQRLTADSLAIEIAEALHDTAVVSPITGARIPVDALTLAADAIKGSTLEAQTRLDEFVNDARPTFLRNPPNEF